jgi:hypothetical protein
MKSMNPLSKLTELVAQQIADDHEKGFPLKPGIYNVLEKFLMQCNSQNVCTKDLLLEIDPKDLEKIITKSLAAYLVANITQKEFIEIVSYTLDDQRRTIATCYVLNLKKLEEY